MDDDLIYQQIKRMSYKDEDDIYVYLLTQLDCEACSELGDQFDFIFDLHMREFQSFLNEDICNGRRHY